MNAALADAARNLLVDCAVLRPGDSVLVVHEDPALGWYDAIAPRAVAREAERLGATCKKLEVGGPANHRNEAVQAAAADHDLTVYFARLGDQDRFGPRPGTSAVMCYARNADALASAYGRTPHRAMRQLSRAVESVLAGAGEIEVRCPLGTRLAGDAILDDRGSNGTMAVRRFPHGVHQPLPASAMSGRVALARFLTPTGSRVYEPACLRLEDTVFARVESGRIMGFEGSATAVRAVEAHYEGVADRFGIDPRIVHSFHAGIHPGCSYRNAYSQDPDRWSNTIFTHPRFLHFHTCGDYAPGEICWTLADHETRVDGKALWTSGRLAAAAFEETRAVIDEWPSLAALIDGPINDLGLGRD